MGSSSSGWYGRRSARPLVHEAVAISTSALRQEGALAPGASRSGTLFLAPRPFRPASYTVDCTHAPDGRLTLIHTFGGAPITEELALEALPQPFGRWRWLFACPRCARRAAILYHPQRPYSRFACRRCHQLVYESTRLDPATRLERKARQIRRRKLRHSPYWPDELAARPRWMSRQRYDHWCAIADEMEALALDLRIMADVGWQPAR